MKFCMCNNGFPCFGCRGPLDEANVPVIKKLFKDLGLGDEEVKKKLIEFVGKAKIVEPEVR